MVDKWSKDRVNLVENYKNREVILKLIGMKSDIFTN